MSALVLVADPDPFNLRLLHEACEAAGYDVVTAADGPEVLAMVARRPPDLLMLDAKMSEIDAFEILRILESRHGTGEHPRLAGDGRRRPRCAAPRDRARGGRLPDTPLPGVRDSAARPQRVEGDAGATVSAFPRAHHRRTNVTRSRARAPHHSF